MQAVPPVAECVVWSLIWPGDESVEGHGHVEDGCGHGVSPFLFCTLSSDSLPRRRDSVLDRPLKARECVRQAGAVLFAKLGGREATLDHRHQRLAVALLKGELGLELEARSVGPRLGRVDDEATGPGDHAEDVVVPVELVTRAPERHGPDAAPATIALGLDDPARVVGAVEGLLAAGLGERVEHLLGGGVDLACESHVLALRPASSFST